MIITCNYSVMCFDEDWMYLFTLANNFCLLEGGHLDELQNADKYPIRWSL